MLSHDAMVENLLAHYDRTPVRLRREYRAWYADERRTCGRIARQYGITVRQAAGIIACYSQNDTWKGNITAVHSFLSNPTHVHGLSIAYGPAKRILNGERPLDVMRGGDHYYTYPGRKPRRWKQDPTKVRNFYRALCGDPKALTMDRHAARGCDPSLENPKGATEYAVLVACYIDAAKARRQRPADMQAIVWCAVRGTGA